MRHFAPNERHVQKAEAVGHWEASAGYCYSTSCWRGGPLQEGGAVTRGPPNESRPRMSGPRPRRTRKERTNNCVWTLERGTHLSTLGWTHLAGTGLDASRWCWAGRISLALGWSGPISPRALVWSHLDAGLARSSRRRPHKAGRSLSFLLGVRLSVGPSLSRNC